MEDIECAQKSTFFARRHVDQEHAKPANILKLRVGAAGKPPGKNYPSGTYPPLMDEYYCAFTA